MKEKITIYEAIFKLYSRSNKLYLETINRNDKSGIKIMQDENLECKNVIEETIKNHNSRVTELLQNNNELLERARKAEAELKELKNYPTWLGIDLAKENTAFVSCYSVDELKKAFIAGFMASGKGFNGEFYKMKIDEDLFYYLTSDFTEFLIKEGIIPK